MSNKILSGIGLLVGLVALVALNLFSNLTFTGVRIDLTEQGAFTLSEGTINTIEAIDEPVTLRLFLSEQLALENPGVTTFANRVKDMLVEYQRRADGMIRLDIIDPEPFSEDEDRAVGYGLHGIPLGAEGTNFYFGLAASNSLDDEVVVPYLSSEREEFLEYDLTKIIWQLLDTKTPVLGVLSTLPIDGAPQRMAPMMGGGAGRPWIIMEQIGETFEVRNLERDIKEIHEQIDVLMVVHPKELSDATLYAIDQFVMRGGRALAFVDPNSEAERPSPMMPQPVTNRASDFSKLLTAWGVGMDTITFVGDLQHALKVRFQYQGRVVTMAYPPWIELPQSRLNKTETATANLGKLVFASAGALEDKTAGDVTFIPLVTSSDSASVLGIGSLARGADPQAMLDSYKPAGQSFVLAARLAGTLDSAFPSGAPTPVSGESQNEDAADTSNIAAKEHLSTSAAPANIVVVADTDLLEDRMWVQVQSLLGSRLAVPTAGNGSFVINVLDILTGSNDLISVRSRGRYSRPFSRIDDIRREAGLRFREKEQQLNSELATTEQRLVELEKSKPTAGAEALVLSAEQQAEIERFRQQKIRIRKELRTVLHERSKNIDALEFNLRMLNIGLMPLFVIIVGLLVAFWRAQRRRVAAS